jgi:adenylate cyclase
MNENKDLAQEAMIEEFWRYWNQYGPPPEQARREKFYKFLPAEKRCSLCAAPFDGFSSGIVKSIFQVFPSRHNPLYCNVCDAFAKKYQGGAEVPITILFADIRGSTTLAENIGAKEFSNLINRFYTEVTRVLIHADAMIEKLVGDEVTAIFFRGITGEDYPRLAIEAGQKLLRVTGHGKGKEPWAPIGIGIHTGETFVGSVGRPDGIMEVTVLGDVPNTASRLTSLAGPGEILVSEETMNGAKINTVGLERRHLELKGRNEKIDAFVFNASTIATF